MNTQNTYREKEPVSIGPTMIEQIIESATNPRKNFAGMDDLIASVKQLGVLAPVHVRVVPAGPKNPDGTYELVSGARRLRAARAAGLKVVPAALLPNCTDEEALEIQITENAQRMDVHPMEEAEAIEKLVKGRGAAGVVDVAKKLGKSHRHVTLRLTLLNLPPKARNAFLDGKMTAEVAYLIARMPTNAMRVAITERLLKPVRVSADFSTTRFGNESHEIEDFPPAKVVARMIQEEYMLRLKEAPFNPADAQLVPAAGACGACPKRTGNSRDLFADVTENELCTDAGCYKIKTAAAFNAKAKKAKEDGRQVITGKEAWKAFSRHRPDSLLHDSGFVDPDEKQYKWGDKSFRNLLGPDAPKAVLLKRADGSAAEVYREADVAAVIQAKKLKPANVYDSRSGSTKNREKLAAERKQHKLECTTKKTVLARSLERMPKVSMTNLLRASLCHLLGRGYTNDADKAALKRQGFTSRKQALSSSNQLKLASLVYELTAGDWKSDYDNSGQEAAGYLGVSYAGVMAELKAAKKDVEQPKKNTPKKG